MKIKVKQSVTGIKGNQPFIAFSVSGKEYDRIKNYHGKDLNGYVIEIYKPKRSTEANAYMWQLIGEIEDRSGISRYDIYRNAVREAGAYYDVTLDTEQVKDYCEKWASHGLAWFVDTDIDIGGKTTLRAYIGSSVYNSKQMTKLVNYVVDEAKLWDIETMTPDELKRLKGLER